MPTVTIEGPDIDDVGIKRVLVKGITDALERAYKIPRAAYVVVIKENRLRTSVLAVRSF